MKLISLFILSCVLFSCSDMKKGKQLEQITVLQTSLDSLQSVWRPEDATVVDSLSKVCASKIDSIGSLYNNQEIDLEIASKIDLFKQSSNDLQELKKIHDFFPTVLNDKKQSLESLKKDITKGSGRREKYDEYIAFEQKELNTIRQQFNDYFETKNRCVERYASSREAVNQLLDSLKNSQENIQK